MKQINLISLAIALIAMTSIFTACGDSNTFTDPRDGQIYKTVKIGDQVWMAENLRYVGDGNDDPAKCPNDDPEMCAKYGRLYKIDRHFQSKDKQEELFWNPDIELFWNPDMGGSHITVCPDGWRLPSVSDYLKLISYTDSVTKKTIGTGKALKAKNKWGDKGGVDAVGFHATPASEKYDVVFLALPDKPYIANSDIWGIRINDDVNAKMFKIQLDDGYAVYENFSIRCIKDSLFEKIIPNFVESYLDSYITNVNKFFNDSIYREKTDGSWTEQYAMFDISETIYFKISQKNDLSKTKIFIQNYGDIKNCPAERGLWSFAITEIDTLKFQCSYQESQIEGCQKLVSPEKKQFFNSECIKIDPTLVKVFKENARERERLIKRKVLTLLPQWARNTRLGQ